MATASTAYRLNTTPFSIELTATKQVVVSNTGETKVLVGLGTPFSNATAHPLPRYGDSIVISSADFTAITVSTDETSGSGVNNKLSQAVVTIVS